MTSLRGIKWEEGNVYSDLRVISFHDFNSNGARWLCQCKCNRTVVFPGHRLRSGEVKDCGCSSKDSYYEKIRNQMSPCERGCSLARDCEIRKLACQDFSDFVAWNRTFKRSPSNPRPTRAIFNRIYHAKNQQQIQGKSRRA